MSQTILECKRFPGGIEYTATTSKTSLILISYITIIILLSSILYLLPPNIMNDRLKISISFIIIIIFFTDFRINITKEKLLIISGLGLQIQRKNMIFKTIRFIPTPSVKDIYIHEALLMDKVVFYLLIELKESDDIIVPFKETFPPCSELINVKRNLISMLNLCN